jgi:hypothetical protein
MFTIDESWNQVVLAEGEAKRLVMFILDHQGHGEITICTKAAGVGKVVVAVCGHVPSSQQDITDYSTW